jgi:hypothetical protein
MKKFLPLCVLVFPGFLPVLGQSPAGPAPAAAGGESKPSAGPSGTNEADRLMQQYMAKRAELLALRQDAGQQAKTARTDVDRKRIQAQLEAAERPLAAQAADLARQYREARQQALGASARKPQ